MGSHSPFLAREGGARVVGIDISDVAIDKARETARAAGLSAIEYHRMNAEQLQFEDESFDLICGTAILHHLDLTRAYAEVARVLRPGGLAVFMEPLGHNPLINLYRRATPQMRTIDEHPLMMRDVHLASRYFDKVSPRYFVLQSLAAVPFHASKHFRSILGVLETADRTLFKMLPFTRRYAWQVILTMERPIKGAAAPRP
jgi:SAM-dependent methyltransferase